MSNVIRMADHAGVPIGSHEELMKWFRSWFDDIEEKGFGELQTMVILCQRKDGQMFKLVQSVKRIEMTELVGLITMAAGYLINEPDSMHAENYREAK